MRRLVKTSIALIGASLLLTGCAATAAAKAAPPTPSPTATHARYDIVVNRTFTLGGVATKCSVSVRADFDGSTAGADANQRVAAAHKFLAAGHWDNDPVSLTELTATELADRRTKESDPEILAGILSDHINAAVTAAGLLGKGVSTQGHVICP